MKTQQLAQVTSFFASFLVACLVIAIFHNYNTPETFFEPLVWVVGFCLAVLAFLGKVKLKDMLLPVAIYFVHTVQRRFFPASNIDFLFMPLMVLSLSYAISTAYFRVFQALFSKNSWRNLLRKSWPHLLISLGISCWAAVLLLLQHWSFETFAFDFGIFDQGLYLLSREGIAVSTVREVSNLFFDHQHFALYLLAPLYWMFRGGHGILLHVITPFLLIGMPSILFYFIVKKLQGIMQFKQRSSFSWIISVSAMLLAIHPYTQSALATGFHEKYLVPSWILLSVLCVLYWFSSATTKSKSLYAFAWLLTLFGWVASKEDQWIFATVFVLQSFVWLLLLQKYVKNRHILSKKRWAFFAIPLALCVSYGVVFLPWFTGKSEVNTSYGQNYTVAKQAIADFIRSPQPRVLNEQLDLLDDAATYMYQHLMTFDLPSLGVFPLNVLGNYAERGLSQNYNHRSPVYHYGVEVPTYSVLSLLILFVLFQAVDFSSWKRVHLQKDVVIILGVMLYVLGFGMAYKWNGLQYFFPRTPTILAEYQETREEREAFRDITQHIPKDASVITSSAYLTHMSARNEVGFWPRTLDQIYLSSLTVHHHDYEYWLLPTQHSKSFDQDFVERIDILHGHNYERIHENQYQQLFKKRQ